MASGKRHFGHYIISIFNEESYMKKKRHNPDKPQNRMGDFCTYYEGHDNYHCCERGWDATKCKGNPHNCIKVKYQILASRSDVQKNNGVGITHSHY